MFERKRKRISIIRPDAAVAESPGTLSVHPDAVASQISVLAYGPQDLVAEDVCDVARLKELAASSNVVWVKVEGLGSLETLTPLAKHFGLHGLALEDVLNIPQRTKIDEYDDHQYIVARMPVADKHLQTEQISIFLGQNFVVTFQERPGDCFEGVRKRLRDGRPRLREGGPDYLVYALLDAVVDAYFPLLEYVGSRLDDLDVTIHENPEQHHLQELHSLKHDLVTLRRYLRPLRELNASLLRQDSTVLSASTRIYMRDCYDHSVHALELVESYATIGSGLMDLYLSLASQRMNEIMKVLTIVATIFIPLSFIAGIYGMNFDRAVSRWNMPELGWTWGYPFALGLMTACAVAMTVYCWKKGWFR